jgi:hypothetical protein
MGIAGGQSEARIGDSVMQEGSFLRFLFPRGVHVVVVQFVQARLWRCDMRDVVVVVVILVAAGVRHLGCA